jgi:hypothetical protein
LPFLVVKRQQAEAAILFNQIKPGQGNKWNEQSKLQANELIEKIKKCNKKGVEING